MGDLCDCGRVIDGSRTLAASAYEKCSHCRRKPRRGVKYKAGATTTLSDSSRALNLSEDQIRTLERLAKKARTECWARSQKIKDGWLRETDSKQFKERYTLSIAAAHEDLAKEEITMRELDEILKVIGA